MNQLRGFAPILLVLIIVAAAYFFTYPQYTSLQQTKGVLATEQEKNKSLKAAEADMNHFLSEYKSNNGRYDQASKILPLKKSELDNVLANLDNYANISGVTLSGVTFTDQSTDATTTTKVADYQITYVQMNIAALGTYPSFRAFLTQLENSLRIMDISKIDLASTETDALDYKMTARVYYQK
jgi:Tfp pilus assembly protein PilO